MFNLNEFLSNEYENEYGNKYLSPMKKNYSEPKIYSANGDLSKRWYVYYRFRNPKTGELQKMSSIYLGANNYKTKTERLQILNSVQKNLSKLLKEGYNPFENNQELYNNQQKEIEIIEPIVEEKKEIKYSIEQALDFALELKKQSLKDTSYRGLNNRINNFSDWIKKNKPDINNIEELSKKDITEFLNSILIKTSPVNRNNFRTDLSSIFQVLVDNEIVTLNFIKNTPILKTSPERNKTFSIKMQEAIFLYLENNDPILLLFIKFISYNFFRPIEICRIKIKDINLIEKNIQYEAKNSSLKTKYIPEILFNDLPDLSKFDGEDFLFTPNQIGGKWDTKETNKRSYFGKRFQVVKTHFGLNKDYGMYSFRHTFITKLYQELRKNSAPFEAKSKLMLITGHSNMSALEKYLRTIDAELPEDYSEMLK